MLASRKNIVIAFGALAFVLALATAIWPDAVKERIARETATAAASADVVHAHNIRANVFRGPG